MRSRILQVMAAFLSILFTVSAAYAQIPTLLIDDANAGKSGTIGIDVSPTLQTGSTAKVDTITQSGSTYAPHDYVAVSSTLLFASGGTHEQI